MHRWYQGAAAALCIGVALARCGGETTAPDAGDAATDTSVGDAAADMGPDAVQDGAVDCHAPVDASCGPCVPCPSIEHGTESCVSSSCVITCDPGYGIMNGGCRPH